MLHANKRYQSRVGDLKASQHFSQGLHLKYYVQYYFRVVVIFCTYNMLYKIVHIIQVVNDIKYYFFHA